MTSVKRLALMSFAILCAANFSRGFADDQHIQRFRSTNDMLQWKQCMHATRGCICNPRPSLLEQCDGNAQCLPSPLNPPAPLLMHADDPTCPVLGKRR